MGWRGMRDLQVPKEFLEHGGTETAPCSTTTDIGIAVSFSASKNVLIMQLHCRSFMHRGANLAFLSAYPDQVEYLYPPLTYLAPTGRAHKHTVTLPTGGEATITVIQVEPVMG